MIRTEGLTRKFGDRTAVDDLSLEVKAGEVLALLGPNGAGKTTTVRMLSCLLAPTGGRAWVAGHRVPEEAPRVRAQVGVLTESPGMYKRLSAYRNLEFYAQLYGVANPRGQAERYLKLFELWDRRSDPVSQFSKGMRQRLALARALLHEPQVLLLDEPTAGLDPESARSVRTFIEELRGRRRAVLLCTHNLPEAERLCDRIALLRTTLVALGRPDQLKEQLFGRRVIVQLANPKPELVGALALPFVKEVDLDGSALSVAVDEPERDNPRLVRRLVELGAEIQYVTEQARTLEDVYLELMEDQDAA
ncbi:MAG: ATP-binding cassette domain-containing protein [Candidatus Bipolaricaulaceae bacterium]